MLEARDLHFAYRGSMPVLAGAGLSVAPGEIVGLRGSSGCGKSTLGRLLAGWLAPARGDVLIDGAGMRPGWSPVQYVHQSSIFAVNPRWRIGRIAEEGWAPDAAACEAMGVSRRWYDRYPHEISGGELQRVALLRALAPRTRYLVADEVTAALDPLTQAAIWRALLARVDAGLGILAISHDAPLLHRIARRRLTLDNGRVAEA